ncbi:hypothetical protein Pan153_10140 [Gimesia panareensis]|uniref:DUF695 domain-containing protein n=1 Tax=Gimesia panareensis TaxID=2527978 RepID=A0A518FJ69_9PLAN|nr:DUF695 domain-containing protein [Gimesia panareensis]QDV16387.1 hypothetical protein Pan153_10140 [Gimesia panareensis]
MEDQWAVGQAEWEGQPLFVRYNTSVQDGHRKGDYPIKVGFALPFHAPSAEGLPGEDEMEQLGEIEELMEDYLGSDGVLVLVLTTGGMRELIFYVRPNTDIAGVHQRLMEDVTSHEVQCMGVEEPGWDSYYAFVSEWED